MPIESDPHPWPSRKVRLVIYFIMLQEKVCTSLLNVDFTLDGPITCEYGGFKPPVEKKSISHFFYFCLDNKQTISFCLDNEKKNNSILLSGQ